jgi:hypothetical protein
MNKDISFQNSSKFGTPHHHKHPPSSTRRAVLICGERRRSMPDDQYDITIGDHSVKIDYKYTGKNPSYRFVHEQIKKSFGIDLH